MEIWGPHVEVLGSPASSLPFASGSSPLLLALKHIWWVMLLAERKKLAQVKVFPWKVLFLSLIFSSAVGSPLLVIFYFI